MNPTPSREIERSQKEAVTRALVEFIARREPKRLRRLFGKFEWNRDFNSECKTEQ